MAFAIDSDARHWTTARFWRADADGRLACTLCPHACRLADGEVGVCRTRRRRGDQMETLGRLTATRHWTPIERKPLFHFRPGLDVLTLANPGCTFVCGYCQNHVVSQYGRDATPALSFAPMEPSDLVAEAAARGGAIGFSYAEPALAAEATLEIAEAAAGRDVPIIWKTNGFLTETALDAIAPRLAAANVDVKAEDPRRHRGLTGADIAPVWEAIRALKAAGVWLEISTPLIPRVVDAPADLAAIAERIADIDPETPWHLLRFNPEYRMANYPPTPPDAIAAAVRIAGDAGLKHVYVERALGADARATRCPSCAETLIDREIWRLGSGRLGPDGRCPSCASPVAGVWSPPPVAATAPHPTLAAGAQS